MSRDICLYILMSYLFYLVVFITSSSKLTFPTCSSSLSGHPASSLHIVHSVYSQHRKAVRKGTTNVLDPRLMESESRNVTPLGLVCSTKFTDLTLALFASI